MTVGLASMLFLLSSCSESLISFWFDRNLLLLTRLCLLFQQSPFADRADEMLAEIPKPIGVCFFGELPVAIFYGAVVGLGISHFANKQKPLAATRNPTRS